MHLMCMCDGKEVREMSRCEFKMYYKSGQEAEEGREKIQKRKVTWTHKELTLRKLAERQTNDVSCRQASAQRRRDETRTSRTCRLRNPPRDGTSR